MMDELPEYDFLEKCKFEKEATGMYVSGHPASEIKDTARRHGAIEIEDILNENSIYENNSKVCIYGVITQDNEWYLSMSMGDSVDNLFGKAHSFQFDKECVPLCPVHLQAGIITDLCCRGNTLLIVRKCSLVLLWGGSWLLGVLRFYSQMRGIPLSEKFWLLFSVGAISAVCSLAIQQVINWLDVRRERAR